MIKLIQDYMTTNLSSTIHLSTDTFAQNRTNVYAELHQRTRTPTILTFSQSTSLSKRIVESGDQRIVDLQIARIRSLHPFPIDPPPRADPRT